MNNEDNFKIEFLYKALDDCQSTIRFTDTKAAAVIGFWTFFITTFLKIETVWYSYVESINHWTELIFLILIIVFMVYFLASSTLLAFLTILPLSNPEKHIDHEDTSFKRVFYLHGYNQPLKSRQLFKKDPRLKLSKKTSEFIVDFKDLSQKEIQKELIFELQKISFIRNLKLDRVNKSISLMIKFIVLFGIMLIYFHGKQIIKYEGSTSLVSFELDVTLFIVLYIGHKIGDYLFQTNYQARHKSERWTPLLIHCFVYTLTVLGMAYIFTGFFNWLAVMVLFITHVLIDKRKFLIIWGKYVKRMKTPNDPKAQTAMLELDQAFHYIVLFFISFM